MIVPDEQESPLSPNDQTPLGDGVTPSHGCDIDGDGVVLSKIEAYLRSYLSFPDNRYFLPLSLFAILEHCWDECFDEVPYLSVSAMVKSAGKTRVLELLSFLAGEEKAILVDGSVTVAALYTEIEERKVILIDESERLQNPNSPFRSILNGGYRRGQTVLRKIGGQNSKFSIFCPKVFAQIGDLHDTLRDRCIVIEMQRTMAGSRKEYVRQVAKERANEIASEIASVVLEKVDNIRDSYLNYHDLYPSIDFLRDRDQEIWKPLFALCQVLASERLPELERSAIDIATVKTRPVHRFEHLKDAEEKAGKLEYAEHLLRDALTVTGDRDRITTADLVKGLRDIGTSPWRSYEGTGITDISLAAMLRFFRVEPKTVRVKPKSEPNSTAKGYYRADLMTGTAAAAQAPPDDEPSRNPVTPSRVEAAKLSMALSSPVVVPNVNVIAAELTRGVESASRKLESVVESSERLNPAITRNLIAALTHAAEKHAAIAGQLSASMPDYSAETKCHQRLVREQMAALAEPDVEEKRRLASDFKHATVREITNAEAKQGILANEYLGSTGSTRYSVGLFIGDYLAGVTCYGSTAGANVASSVCGPEHKDKVLTIVRGYCEHWAHKDSASFILSRACDLMAARGYGNVFVAYSDPAANEIGTVYQAANFLYTGMTSASEKYRTLDGKIHDGRQVSGLTRDRRNGGLAYKRTRKQQKAILETAGAEFFQGNAKHRYVYFAGDKRTKRELLRALKWETLPYPKRPSAATDPAA